MMIYSNVSGHDIQFHLQSWMETARQWHEGILYPRWAEWANWGFGEPRFIFYPPASWIIGAALGQVLPWRAVPGAFIWLALIVAGIAMWKLAREWLEEPYASLAAILYAVNPYHLVIVYWRSDFAELLAGALFPLVLWGAVRISRGEWRQVPLLAAIFAGVWISNAPAGVMATYSLPLAIAVGCILRRSLRPIVPGVAAMAGGFGLAAFYILPAASERRWVQIGQVVGDDLLPWQNFLFTHNNELDFIQFNRRVSWIALGVILVTVIATRYAARRRREMPEVWWIVAVIGAVAVFLMLPPSTPLWRFLPELKFMQFPWRWLEALGVAYALFIAATTNGQKNRAEWHVAAVVLAATAATAAVLMHTTWWETGDVPAVADAIRSGHGYEGTDEYMSIGGDRYQLPGNPDDDTRPEGVSDQTASPIGVVDPSSGSIVSPGTAQIHINRWTSELRIFTVTATAPMQVAPRLLVYPAWKVTVDGKNVTYSAQPQTAQMSFSLGPGNRRIEIRFARTSDRIAGAIISLLSAAIVLAGFATRRPPAPRQISRAPEV